jgi:hypothetical protein
MATFDEDVAQKQMDELMRLWEETEPLPPDEPDPVVLDIYSGRSIRALVTARDELARARAQYDEAILDARTAGLSWGEIGVLLKVSRQQLHRRYRAREAGKT